MPLLSFSKLVRFSLKRSAQLRSSGCPPPKTCKATVGRDLMGGREIVVGESVSSVVLSSQGSLCCTIIVQQCTK